MYRTDQQLCFLLSALFMGQVLGQSEASDGDSLTIVLYCITGVIWVTVFAVLAVFCFKWKKRKGKLHKKKTVHPTSRKQSMVPPNKPAGTVTVTAEGGPSQDAPELSSMKGEPTKKEVRAVEDAAPQADPPPKELNTQPAEDKLAKKGKSKTRKSSKPNESNVDDPGATKKAKGHASKKSKDKDEKADKADGPKTTKSKKSRRNSVKNEENKEAAKDN